MNNTTAASIRNQMTAKVASQTIEMLWDMAEQIAAMKSTEQTRMVSAMVSDEICKRLDLDEKMDEIFMDLEFEGSYLDAMKIAAGK